MASVLGRALFQINVRFWEASLLENLPTLEEKMKKSLWRVVAGNLALFALAVMVSCSCLCGDKNPAIGSAPFRSCRQDPSGKGEAWRFVVSGDSRNCGDVVMPAIATCAKTDNA